MLTQQDRRELLAWVREHCELGKDGLTAEDLLAALTDGPGLVSAADAPFRVAA